MEKKDLLKQTIEHIDIKKIDSTDLIDAMRGMSFSSRDTANAADIFQRMMNDKDCSVIMTLAGSTSAAVCGYGKEQNGRLHRLHGSFNHRHGLL